MNNKLLNKSIFSHSNKEILGLTNNRNKVFQSKNIFNFSCVNKFKFKILKISNKYFWKLLPKIPRKDFEPFDHSKNIKSESPSKKEEQAKSDNTLEGNFVNNEKFAQILKEEKEETPQEKYKEIFDDTYFQNKEIFTRQQIYSIRRKLRKLSKADPEWGIGLHRKFLQRNFLKRENNFNNADDEIKGRQFDLNFIQSLKLTEPVAIYESLTHSLSPYRSTKRHFVVYAILLPYLYINFFFNYDFLFSFKAGFNFAYPLLNVTFFLFMLNLKYFNFYKNGLVIQLKYDPQENVLLFYTHKYFRKGVNIKKVRLDDVYAFQKKSFSIGEYIFVKLYSKDSEIFLFSQDGIWHEKELFENIFNFNIEKFDKVDISEFETKLNEKYNQPIKIESLDELSIKMREEEVKHYDELDHEINSLREDLKNLELKPKKNSDQIVQDNEDSSINIAEEKNKSTDEKKK